MARPPAIPQARPAPATRARLERSDYRTLSQFRFLLRCFLEFSQNAARRVGLTTRQHQALLAIKGFPHADAPTIGDLATRLRIRPHSAGELVDRLVESGLVVRSHDADDRRRVRLALTAVAEERLADLSFIHLDELHRLRPALQQILWLLHDQAADPAHDPAHDPANRPPAGPGS